MTQQEFARIEAEAEATVRKLGLPPCPDILIDIGREVRREAPDVRRIAALVGRDVASSAGVLKIVNSACFGLDRKARSVHQAINYLGLNRTALLLAGLLFRNAFPVASHPALVRFWQTSMQLGSTVSHLARLLHAFDIDEAHTYGLFREAGSAVLICKFVGYSDVPAADDTAARITDVEKSRFGVDHAVIGAVLAKDWQLPAEMSDAILWHHADFVLDLEERPIADDAARLIALGMLADRVIERYRAASPESYVPADVTAALRLFGLNAAQFADLQLEAMTVLAEADTRPMPTMRLKSMAF